MNELHVKKRSHATYSNSPTSANSACGDCVRVCVYVCMCEYFYESKSLTAAKHRYSAFSILD